MNNNDFTMFFITMSLINFSIGISNSDKNDEIKNKLNKILELLNERK